mmetsp:Transcript_1703/g.3821  ORF Transcript_1703/g.3821 Transcript_1703/m.3821 type:complete len:304 (+) Transcript_1703:203-1114(+)
MMVLPRGALSCSAGLSPARAAITRGHGAQGPKPKQQTKGRTGAGNPRQPMTTRPQVRDRDATTHAHLGASPGAAGRPMTSASTSASLSERATTAADLSSCSNQQLSVFRALVLDVSYRPIDTLPWTRAVVLDFFDKVDVLEYYDSFVRSARNSHYLPAVIRVKFYVKKLRGTLDKGVPMSRKNIYIRDKHQCQYCGSRRNLTMDHVVPLSKGGKTSWENMVAACSSCNQVKGDKLLSQIPGMSLTRKPRKPSAYEMSSYLVTSSRTPKEWVQYLPPGHTPWTFDPVAPLVQDNEIDSRKSSSS